MMATRTIGINTLNRHLQITVIVYQSDWHHLIFKIKHRMNRRIFFFKKLKIGTAKAKHSNFCEFAQNEWWQKLLEFWGLLDYPYLNFPWMNLSKPLNILFYDLFSICLMANHSIAFYVCIKLLIYRTKECRRLMLLGDLS